MMLGYTDFHSDCSM
jgi:hypothetical protein